MSEREVGESVAGISRIVEHHRAEWIVNGKRVLDLKEGRVSATKAIIIEAAQADAGIDVLTTHSRQHVERDHIASGRTRRYQVRPEIKSAKVASVARFDLKRDLTLLLFCCIGPLFRILFLVSYGARIGWRTSTIVFHNSIERPRPEARDGGGVHISLSDRSKLNGNIGPGRELLKRRIAGSIAVPMIGKLSFC